MPPKGRLRVGTAPVNWNNNDLQGWRPVVPFPAILDEMLAAGYVETEWDEAFGTDVESLNRERQLRGMSFTGAYRWLDFVNDRQFVRDLEAIRSFLETLQGIGAGHLIVADALRPHRVAIAGSVPDDGSASLDQTAYDRLAMNLGRLVDVACTYGLSVHYHNHVGSYVETPGEVNRLIESLGGTGADLCFDTGHFAFGGGDVLSFLQANSDQIGYLHLKDVDPVVLATARSMRWSFLDALRHIVFCPVGSGHAQIAAIIEHLTGTGFRHVVIIEQDTAAGDSTETARANLETVRRFEAMHLNAGRSAL